MHDISTGYDTPQRPKLRCAKCGLYPRHHHFTACKTCRNQVLRAASIKAWRTRKTMAKARLAKKHWPKMPLI